MQPPIPENKLLFIITLILALFFTTFYIVYTPPSTTNASGTDKLAQHTNLGKQGTTETDIKENACDKVDILWL